MRSTVFDLEVRMQTLEASLG